MEFENKCPGCGLKTVSEISEMQFNRIAAHHPDWVCGEKGNRLMSVNFCKDCESDPLGHPEPHYDPN